MNHVDCSARALHRDGELRLSQWKNTCAALIVYRVTTAHSRAGHSSSEISESLNSKEIGPIAFETAPPANEFIVQCRASSHQNSDVPMANLAEGWNLVLLTSYAVGWRLVDNRRR